MNYGFVVKPSDDVPLELIEQFNIPTAPVIYRGSESREDVAGHFVENIVDVSRKIEELLKTTVPINKSDEDIHRHNANKNCNFCKRSFDTTDKVRDHCHLTGKFRQSLCSRCNINLKQPKFVPCFFYNLSIVRLRRKASRIQITNMQNLFVHTLLVRRLVTIQICI